MIRGCSGGNTYPVCMAMPESKSNISLYTMGHIVKKRVKFLLDSGAVLSVMTGKLARTLKLPALKKTDHKLVGATGQDLKVLGVAKDILIKLGELQFLTDFIVVENLIAPAVLGSNFLLSNSIVIYCEKMVVRKRNRCTPLLTENSKNGKMLVTVEQ